jgi:hypothetical protein
MRDLIAVERSIEMLSAVIFGRVSVAALGVRLRLWPPNI